MPKLQCWIAKIGLRGKSITIGRFDDLEKAAQARRAAEADLYDPIIEEYDRTNKKD